MLELGLGIFEILSLKFVKVEIEQSKIQTPIIGYSYSCGTREVFYHPVILCVVCIWIVVYIASWDIEWRECEQNVNKISYKAMLWGEF